MSAWCVAKRSRFDGSGQPNARVAGNGVFINEPVEAVTVSQRSVMRQPPGTAAHEQSRMPRGWPFDARLAPSSS
jgi:hypothetical protein